MYFSEIALPDVLLAGKLAAASIHEDPQIGFSDFSHVIELEMRIKMLQRRLRIMDAAEGSVEDKQDQV